MFVYIVVQSINDDLNASLATADELSREFSSLMSEATPVVQTTTSEVQNTRLSHISIDNYEIYKSLEPQADSLRTVFQ